MYGNIDNAILGKILDIFWEVYRLGRERCALPAPANPIESYNSHLAIFRALQNRDAQALRSTVANHYLCQTASGQYHRWSFGQGYPPSKAPRADRDFSFFFHADLEVHLLIFLVD